jgi:hypothetical protein
MGNEVPIWQGSLEKKLLVLRLQARHVMSPSTVVGLDASDLGSVVFADTFFQLDPLQGHETAMNITKNVPSLQLWFTTHKHYEHIPLPILTEKNLHCE